MLRVRRSNVDDVDILHRRREGEVSERSLAEKARRLTSRITNSSYDPTATGGSLTCPEICAWAPLGA